MILYVTVAVELGKKVIDERFGDCIEYYLAPNTQHKVWPWIFPKRDVVTLGTGGYMTQELISNAYPTVNTYMENFLNLPIVKKKLDGGKIVSYGLHLEFDGQLPRTTTDGLILTGEGMVESFFTGVYAAVAAAAAIKEKNNSAEFLAERFQEQMNANAYLTAFYYVAAENKKSILSMTDEEITYMMQNVVLSGGFLRVNETACTGCGKCRDFCACGVWEKAGEIYKPVRQDLCAECGACWNICPAEAVELDEPSGGTGVVFTFG
ncbi:MAG: hypothetical protein EHM28_10000 [Spirochaetaceae bacterium]|nr:MAG: hypothetical protein EHM28_10000 [Spirochaetaceae bacterium]